MSCKKTERGLGEQAKVQVPLAETTRHGNALRNPVDLATSWQNANFFRFRPPIPSIPQTRHSIDA